MPLLVPLKASSGPDSSLRWCSALNGMASAAASGLHAKVSMQLNIRLSVMALSAPLSANDGQSIGMSSGESPAARARSSPGFSGRGSNPRPMTDGGAALLVSWVPESTSCDGQVELSVVDAMRGGSLLFAEADATARGAAVGLAKLSR